MKVFLIASSPATGLLYNSTRIALALKSRGFEIHVATHGNGEQTPGLARSLENAGIQIHRFPELGRSGLHALLGDNRSLRRTVRELDPDVIHMFGAVSAFQVGTGRRARKVAMIAAMGHKRKSSLPSHIGAMLLNRFVDVVIAQCQAEHQRLIKLGVHRNKLRIVFTPLDCENFLSHLPATPAEVQRIRLMSHLPDGRRILGFFANLQPSKRPDLLLRSFGRVSHEFADWDVVIAGEGPERGACERLAHELGLNSRVHFLGRIPNSDVVGLLSICDAVAHCSNAETFGYSMIEPLLLSKPTVVTRIGVGHELEDDRQAVVVDPDSLPQFVAGLRRVMNPDNHVQRMVETEAAYVRGKYDIQPIVDRLVEIYLAGQSASVEATRHEALARVSDE
jgi:glycosyltransferase involved in cell wall biosynthesis